MTDATRPARTRFAPSPTGFVHIGSLRTVIFNWLWARHTGGQFLLRIEDTDRNRYVPGAEEQLLQSLRMMDLLWDEGPDIGGPHAPYRQSERLPIYHRHAEELLQHGYLYKCWCPPERLKQVNEERMARKEPPGYDRRCRFLSAAERAAEEASGKPYVLRLAVPLEGETVVNDLIRGPIVFQNALQNDAVMIKSDGFPTYHFAVVVDDHLMQITHVLRADEWIATSPLHVLLYQFFGWEQPVWVHVPNVLGPDGKKLSKRHGDTSVTEYLEKGYLPEALFNVLALVGWGPDDNTEILSREELIQRFDIKRIQPSGGIFNLEKLNRFNGIYIRKLTPQQLAERILPYLQQAGLVATPASEAERARVEELVPLIQERLVVLSEAPDQLAPFFVAPESYDRDLLIPKKLDAATTRHALQAAHEALAQLEAWSVPAIEATLRALAEQLGLKVGDFFMALRVAATGRKVSPPLFETLHALGRAETLQRLERAAEALTAATAA
ncbi:glutamate--tRNA ligase [Kallotenue papyrolyticum]|uniref:glutamate--tRNA ligase n=1 Tax=Kallotenue papyrolyticum TaxID=1325125 RepID=UPI0004785E0A|nr:glutamate--tRNA ligase [Kallotenue papyrolyticum]